MDQIVSKVTEVLKGIGESVVSALSEKFWDVFPS